MRTSAEGCLGEGRVTSVSAVLAVVSFCAFLIAPGAVGALPPQQPPTPQAKAPKAEELASLRQRAETGDAAAQHALGALYLTGQGIPMDKAEALKWFAIEAAGANGDQKARLCSAFDSLAASVDQSEMEEALMRASLWVTAYRRRSGNPRGWEREIVTAVFGATGPRVQKGVRPTYPQAAGERKIEGTGELDCIINADGSVRECQVVRSVDTVYGVDQAALDAVRKWRFIPGIIRGKPAPFPVTIEFTLR